MAKQVRSSEFVCIQNPWSERDHQISTSNYKAEKDRITKKKLAEYIAKRIKAYLKELTVSRL